MTGFNRRAEVRAFTLIELLVVVSIVALLISILLPSLRNAREQAKEVVCASNMAGFGRGFYSYAGDNQDYLCSGSFDPDVANGRDGPVDKVGWVADLVNGQYAFPGTALCPANEARYNQKLGMGASSGFYTPLQAKDLIDRGYNTNYTQMWYMGRSEARWPPVPPGDTNWKRVASCLGPLKSAAMLSVAPSRVPILGDGGVESDDLYQGQKTVKSMTDGPFGGPPYGIQDYSDIGPAHGFGKRYGVGLKAGSKLRANIIFADGHVGKFVDKVRNGEFRLLAPSPATPYRTQEDLGPDVFDGAISRGRRSFNGYEFE
jgi:prepilin-type N-terminal cleavage/methylation domain-containing protein/prepilin-type processing-associated H-X9-DG protein